MNGLGRAVRDARWAARGLILSDTGARPGCCCYRDTSSDGGDNRCQQLAAEWRDNSYRTPEEESNGLAAAQPHLAFRLVTTAATTPPPTAELRLTDRPGMKTEVDFGLLCQHWLLQCEHREPYCKYKGVF